MGVPKSEKQIQSEILTGIKYEHPETRLFNNSVGVARYGNDTVRYGLINGASDLLGWTTIEITPDMVGKKIAIFTAIEVKKKGGRTTALQDKFLNNVRKASGIEGVARSLEDANDIISRGVKHGTGE